MRDNAAESCVRAVCGDDTLLLLYSRRVAKLRNPGPGDSKRLPVLCAHRHRDPTPFTTVAATLESPHFRSLRSLAAKISAASGVSDVRHRRSCLRAGVDLRGSRVQHY